MKLLVLISVLIFSGCGSFQKRITYQYSGLVIVMDTEAVLADKCPTKRACYFPSTKEAWIRLGDLEAAIHELCHHFCHEALIPIDDQKACNVRCDTTEWEHLKK